MLEFLRKKAAKILAPHHGLPRLILITQLAAVFQNGPAYYRV